MFRNYLKVAFRSLARDRFFSILNLLGLTTGIAAFLLITLYVRFELSYDSFHDNLDRIRAWKTIYMSAEGNSAGDSFSVKGGQTFEQYLPEIEDMVQLSGGYEALLSIDQESHYNDQWFYSDNSLFNVFTFPLVRGVAKLDVPKTAVVTESWAQRHFGEADPIGQVVVKDKTEQFEITAIVADPPGNSYIQFDILFSDILYLEKIENERDERSKWSSFANTYFLLTPGTNEEQLLEKMSKVGLAHFSEESYFIQEGKLVMKPALVPFKDIHLRSGIKKGLNTTSDIAYVYLFSAIAALILIIACINYINLSTARYLKRAKETGLRKAIGASRNQLIWLYLGESMVLTTISVLLAFAITERILPLYNQLVERSLSLRYDSIEFFFTVVVINLTVGLTAGIYPALKLSGYEPLHSIRGGRTPKERKHLRRTLVLVQFIIAQVLIVATVVIQFQLRYMQNKDLGYTKEHALYISTFGEVADNSEVFAQAISQIPGVESQAYSGGIFTRAAITFMHLNEIEGNEEASEKEYVVADVFNVSEDFLDVMKLEILEGSGFKDSLSVNPNETILITEATVKRFGWENPIGMRFKTWGANRYVIGVVKDFHNESLRAELTPTFLVLDEKSTRYLNIRISPIDMDKTLDRIEAAWEASVPDRPFTYTFYDDKFDQHYKKERQLGRIFFVFASLAIGISLLGVIGLTAFTTEQRLKEIGIRKVLGSSVSRLVVLLSKEFVWLGSIAFAIITPITYYLMQGWLEVFKYRISIDAVIYVVALMASLGVGWLVVCLQSARAARVNPAELLRNE